MDLALGKHTTKFVDFAMHRVRMLLHFGITPYLVFDGDRLPSKAATEQARAQRRQESTRSGLELLALGKTALAYQEIQKSVDITSSMARMLIVELNRNAVKYVVAPYEADSQLAYLEKKGYVDAVLSEDSDLLVFGVRCLLTKLDQYGACVMVRQDDFTACRDVNFGGWSVDDFRRMAILSGCDYLEGIHRMGLKTAHRLVRKYKTIDKIIRGAQLEGKFRIPPGYIQDFQQAEMTFLYQWVFCPEVQALVNLKAPESAEQLDGIMYIGSYVAPDIAKKVASGILDPSTKLPITLKLPQVQSWRNRRTPYDPRQSTSLACDTSKAKSIESFFPKMRVPLAELDPNSLKPNPSQQRLLDDQGPAQNWPSDRAPLHRREHRGFVPGPNPPNKRRRLCAEAPEPQSLSAKVEKSRFFQNSLTSRTEERYTTSSKKKEHDFEIFTDDGNHNVNIASANVTSVSCNEAAQDMSKCVSKNTAKPRNDCDAAESKAAAHISSSRPSNEDADGPDPGPAFTESLCSEARALRERTNLGDCKFSRNPKTPSKHGRASVVPSDARYPKDAAEDVSVVITETPVTKKASQIGISQVPSPLKGSEEFLVPESETDSEGAKYDDDNADPVRAVASSSDGETADGSKEGEEENVMPIPEFDLHRFALSTVPS